MPSFSNVLSAPPLSPTLANVQDNGNKEWKQKEPAGRPEVSKLQQQFTGHSSASIPGHNLVNGHSGTNGTEASSMQQPSDTTNGSQVNTNQALEVSILTFNALATSNW